MELNKCLGCMEPFQSYPCPGCGFDPKNVKGAEYALPLETILSGKYLVGRVLGQAKTPGPHSRAAWGCS